MNMGVERRKRKRDWKPRTVINQLTIKGEQIIQDAVCRGAMMDASSCFPCVARIIDVAAGTGNSITNSFQNRTFAWTGRRVLLLLLLCWHCHEQTSTAQIEMGRRWTKWLLRYDSTHQNKRNSILSQAGIECGDTGHKVTWRRWEEEKENGRITASRIKDSVSMREREREKEERLVRLVCVSFEGNLLNGNSARHCSSSAHCSSFVSLSLSPALRWVCLWTNTQS